MWLFRDSLSLGFLLDDFFHLDYLMRAFGGEPGVLLRLLWSNWSPDTTLVSYRPLVSFSLGLDYAIWHINAMGYHITNLVLFGGCIALVALLARELCIAFDIENRLAPPIGAAFLFAAYPLHPEAVAWIIGRVDLLCGAFTFLSAYLYMLNRRTNSRACLAGAIISFIFAMMSKEMAVTLPAVLTVFELLAPTDPAAGRIKFRLSRPLVYMWASLLVFAIFRTIILGTVVGGYGGTGWKTIKQGFKNFADVPTLSKLFFGASEELQIPDPAKTLAWATLALIAFCAVRLAFIQKYAWRLYLVLIAWTFLTILPTFQIWHIWPNLVGSRLFYIGSAPLCMLLSIAALGTTGSIVRSAAGWIGVAGLCLTWSALLQFNMEAWNGAAMHLSNFRHAIATRFPELAQSRKMFIPVLPQDYKGAPMLGRPEYLAVLCRPPFADKDYTPYILTAEPYIAGGNELVGPQSFKEGRMQSSVVLFDQNDPMMSRVNDPPMAPAVRVSPAPPLSLKDRLDWLHRKVHFRTILDYDASMIPNAATVHVYISKPWQPFSNAVRPAPPDKQTVETDIGPLPLHSSAVLPKTTPGVHDIAVLALDKDEKPVGNLSETVSIRSW